jgi:ABC transporter DrrB family efflux protein
MTALAWTAIDGWVITKRNLTKIRRVPDLLVLLAVQPIIFVLIFAYILGSSISIPGVNYREYLMAGIFTQTVAFGSGITATGIADDLHRGVVDRFRSLPMAHSSVLLGRTTCDLLMNVLVAIVMALCGLAVGWRIHTGPVEAAAGFVLLLSFGYALSWAMALVGLLVRSVEVAQSAGSMWLFPIVFLSNAFISSSTLPPGLRLAADWNPVSSVVLAIRDLWGNAPAGPARGSGFPAQHSLLLAILWTATMLALFAPLAVARYRRILRR